MGKPLTIEQINIVVERILPSTKIDSITDEYMALAKQDTGLGERDSIPIDETLERIEAAFDAGFRLAVMKCVTLTQEDLNL